MVAESSCLARGGDELVLIRGSASRPDTDGTYATDGTYGIQQISPMSPIGPIRLTPSVGSLPGTDRLVRTSGSSSLPVSSELPV